MPSSFATELAIRLIVLPLSWIALDGTRLEESLLSLQINTGDVRREAAGLLPVTRATSVARDSHAVCKSVL